MRAETPALPVSAPAPARRIEIPSVFRCGALIFAIKIALRTLGFGRTIRWIRQRVETVPAMPSVRHDVVETAEQAVAMAGALYPGRAKCLEQSLVLYYILRRQGIAVKYCQGAQPYPFQAHAWIEFRGQVINDVAEHIKPFLRLPDQLP